MNTYEDLLEWVIHHVDPAELQEGPDAAVLWFVCMREAYNFIERNDSVKDIARYFLDGIDKMDRVLVNEHLEISRDAQEGEYLSYLIYDLNEHFKGHLL